MKKKVIIMGAAGRDFHNFNMCFKDNPGFEVVAFTAAQIPFIINRAYPAPLAGPLYPEGIPIASEDRLADLIKADKVDQVIFSYSDVSNEYIMRRAALCSSLDADFVLLGAEKTMLKSRLPVISVCAVRTGCGKSGVTRFIAKGLVKTGKKAVAIRHPMPYGDLLKQKVQRFATLQDLKTQNCTIEEMEEYEPLISSGIVVFAGVDYREILKEAEKEAEIIIWDGGNNDLPFIRPDLSIVVADPLRAGHELLYFHGEVNLQRADCIVVNKANTASAENIEIVIKNIKEVNPGARVVKTASKVEADPAIAGKKVLVIEDGPTLTHGGMSYGAGIIAAKTFNAEPVDVKPYAVGTIKDTLKQYPHLENLLPAMGYSKAQIKELEETINRTPCDAVLIATPVDLTHIINIEKPTVRVGYEIKEMDTPGLASVVNKFLERVIK